MRQKGFILSLIFYVGLIVVAFFAVFFFYGPIKIRLTETTAGGNPVGIVLASNGWFYVIDYGFVVSSFDSAKIVNPVIWVFDPENITVVDNISIPYSFERTCSNRGIAFSTKVLFGCNDKTTVFDVDTKSFNTNVIKITGGDKLLVDLNQNLLHTYYTAYSQKNFQPVLPLIKPKSLEKKYANIRDFAIKDNKKYLFGCYGSDEVFAGPTGGFLEKIDLVENKSEDVIFLDGCVQYGVFNTDTGITYFVEQGMRRTENLVKYDINEKKIEETLDLGTLHVTRLSQDRDNLYLIAGEKPSQKGEKDYFFIVKKANLSDYKKIDIKDFNIPSYSISITVLNGRIYMVGGSKKQEPLLVIYNSEGKFLNKLNLRKEAKVNN